MNRVSQQIVLCLLILSLAACSGHKSHTDKKPINVTTYTVVKHNVPYALEFIGTTQSISSVDIRARVKGFLVKRHFKEGTHVKQSQLLYIIDKRQYEANLAMAKATLEVSIANLIFQEKEAIRMKNLVKKGAVSKERFDQVTAKARAAEAQVARDKANVEQAKLNLSYCTMYAPIKGRIGKTLVNVGNLVGGTQNTKLATIVRLDPIYVVFNPSAKRFALISYYLLIKKVPITITLPGDRFNKFYGYIDFINNEAEKQTSTVMLRATVANPNKVLIPNLYVKVIVHLTTIQDTLTVPSKSIVQTQGLSYVYILGAKNQALKTEVKTGRTVNHQTVITHGLHVGDKVIVDNLLRLKRGTIVKP